MGILTFDWGQITYTGSPFATPWWVAANVGISVAFFYWFLVPILYVRPSYLLLLRFLFNGVLLFAVHQRLVQLLPSLVVLTHFR